MQRRIRVPLANTPFKVGLLLLILKTMVSLSGVVPYNDTADTFISVMATVFLGISILMKRFPAKVLCIYVFVALVALYTTLRVGSLSVLLTVMTCLALREEDIEDVVRFTFFYEVVFFIAHFALAIIMMLFGGKMYAIHNGIVRYHFGFVHPNSFAIVLVNISVMWLWLKYDKVNTIDIVGMVCINAAGYFYTKCRTALGIMLAVVILRMLFFKNRNTKILKITASLCVPALSLIMLVLISQYISGAPMILLIDKLLSLRIKLGAYALEHYGLTFAGQDMTEITVMWDSFWQLNGHTFDNVYSFLLINYGFLWLLFLIVLFYKLAQINSEKDNIVILLWAIYGITEVHIINPFLFFPIMLVSKLFQNRHMLRNRITPKSEIINCPECVYFTEKANQ